MEYYLTWNCGDLVKGDPHEKLYGDVGRLEILEYQDPYGYMNHIIEKILQRKVN